MSTFACRDRTVGFAFQAGYRRLRSLNRAISSHDILSETKAVQHRHEFCRFCIAQMPGWL
jgi:hypothetical protein